MNIKEASQLVGCTCRAIKFYEEKGLLPAVARRENGYRDYTEADINRLHEIQAYRKLGIGIGDIKALLRGNETQLLDNILNQKRAQLEANQSEIEALTQFIISRSEQALNESIDYPSLEQAIRSQLPGLFGAYLATHFAPYLNIRITTSEQKSAYHRILAFWDNTDLHLPLLYCMVMRITCLLPAADAAQIDAQMQNMLHMSEHEYEAVKSKVIRTVRMRENPLIRYSPAEVFKRRMMRSLRNCGYYDIFIPAMETLSPPYKAYRDAMNAMNDRLCRDLGLYYDADFNLRLKHTEE